MVPIFNYGKTLPVLTKDAAEILLYGSVPNDRICTDVPVFVQHNVEFIVAIEKLGDWKKMTFICDVLIKKVLIENININT